MIGLVVGFPPSVLVLRGLSVSSDWLVSAAIILTANLLDGQIDPTVLSKLWMFLWGAFGSFALDVVAYGESFTSADRAKARLHRRAGYAGARLLLLLLPVDSPSALMPTSQFWRYTSAPQHQSS
jgi:hypothetical protein